MRTPNEFRNDIKVLWPWVLSSTAFIIFPVLGNISAYVALFVTIGVLFVLKPNLNRLLLPVPLGFLSAYVLLVAVSATHGMDDTLQTAVSFIPFPIGALLCASLVDAKKPVDPTQFVASIGALTAYVALAVGLFDVYARGLNRAAGLESSAIYFSNIAVIAAFLAIVPALSRSKVGLWRWLGFGAGMFAGVLGGSRGLFLIVPPMVGVFAISALFMLPFQQRVRLFLAVVLGAIFIWIALPFTPAGARIMTALRIFAEVLSSGSTTDSSVQYRLDFYRGAIGAIGDSPWLGHGWTNVFAAARAHMPEFGASYTSQADMHLHNDLLTFTVASGLGGALAYLMIVFSPLIQGLRQMSLITPLALLVFGYLAMGLTDAGIFYEGTKTVFALFAACLGALAFGLNKEYPHFGTETEMAVETQATGKNAE